MPSLGFGIERLGLLPLGNPKKALAALLLVSLVAMLGLLNLQPSGSLSNLFRSGSVEFQNYEKLKQQFPTSEYDVMLLLSNEDLLTPDKLEKLREIQLELEFAEGVNSILSMFTMRGVPNDKGYSSPLFPADIPTDAGFEALKQKIVSHPQITKKFLTSPAGKSDMTALMVLSLKEGTTDAGKLKSVIGGIRKTVGEMAGEPGFKLMLTGAPVMQLEIRNAIKHDRITFNVIGFTLGVLICLFFFRRPVLVLISSISPGFAVLWIMGLLGHLGQSVSTFINVIPPLIMVIALSDAMHMVFSIQKGIRNGKSKRDAVRHAVLTVGPACVLTSLTTTIALLSLSLTDSADIRQFGLAAAGGTILAFVAVIFIVPTLSMLLLGDEEEFRQKDKGNFNPLLWLEQMCLGIAGVIVPRWRVLAVVGLLLSAVFTYFHLQIEPRYRLSDQMPDTVSAMQALDLVDAKLSGAQQINVMISWPQGQSFATPTGMSAVREVHELLQATDKIQNVTSLETIWRYIKRPPTDAGRSFYLEYVNKLPTSLRHRYLDNKGKTALATGQIQNLEAAEIEPIVKALKAKLAALAQKYPGFSFTPAGLTVVSATQSTDMISQMNQGFMIAIIIVIVLLGLAFRSFDAALLSIFPNLIPIAAVGSVIYLSGDGLQFASVMGLTVAFGLAVDDTIHFLNRYKLEQRNSSDEEENVTQTVAHIGPVLILTTLVLLCGLSVTSLSDLPVTRLFGQLSMATLAAALVADLVILPAIVLAARKLKPFGHDFALEKRRK